MLPKRILTLIAGKQGPLCGGLTLTLIAGKQGPLCGGAQGELRHSKQTLEPNLIPFSTILFFSLPPGS